MVKEKIEMQVGQDIAEIEKVIHIRRLVAVVIVVEAPLAV